MHVIVLVSQKGGAGKTTLAAHIAIAAEAGGDGPANIRFFVKHESTKTRKKACVQRHHQVLACVLGLCPGAPAPAFGGAPGSELPTVRRYVLSCKHEGTSYFSLRSFVLSV